MGDMIVTVSSTGSSSTNSVNPSIKDMNWFAGVAEDELFYYTGCSDVDSLWAVIGSFVPPPPRTPYLLEEGIATDGLTTCDLCSWALRNERHSFSLDSTLEAPGELGWVLTLVIVSLVSAGIGAVVMVTLLHCRRLKIAGGRSNCCGIRVEDTMNQESWNPSGRGAGGGGISETPDRPQLELDKLPPYHNVASSPGHNVWSWLGSRRGGGVPGVAASPLTLPQHRHAMNLPVENHYTHMQTNETLYAELDSQAASYASDLQLQMQGSSTYGTTSGGQDDEYHELDAARLHRHYGEGNGESTLPRDALRTRHSQRLRKPDYEMYENGPTTPVSPNLLPHHHHHQNHYSPMLIGGAPGEHPFYQNTAYTESDAEPDGPTLSSAPSSAYYSDLSSNSANQQMSPPVLSTATLTLNPQTLETPQYRLAAINETTVPSDYI